jgi:hypothetical protein
MAHPAPGGSEIRSTGRDTEMRAISETFRERLEMAVERVGASVVPIADPNCRPMRRNERTCLAAATWRAYRLRNNLAKRSQGIVGRGCQEGCTMRLAFASPAASTVIDAARLWRIARDRGEPVQPALFARLGIAGSGFLAPVLDGLLTLFEAAFRRRFDAGDPADGELTRDERRLLELLERADAAAPSGIRPDLAGALRTALRSTRIMLRSVLGRGPGDPG